MRIWSTMLCVALLGLSVSIGARTARATQLHAQHIVTLTYSFWDLNQEPAMQRMVDVFTRAHPSIHIRFRPIDYPSYFIKLQADALSGTLPDVFWMNGPHFVLFASSGALMPLNTRLKAAHFNLGVYPPSLVNLYTLRGVHYALPRDFDVIGLWYNKSLFDAAHVPYPTNNWTWKTLEQTAKKLTDPGKGVYGFLAYRTNQEGYYNTIFQNGGYVISRNKHKSGYDDPRTIGGLKFWIDMLKAGVSPGVQQMSNPDKDILFKSGKVAMEFGGDWLAGTYAGLPYTKNRVDVVMLPKGKVRATVIHGLGNVISASTKHPKEAFEFLSFLGSRQAASILANTGTVIPAYKGSQQPWVSSLPRYHLKNFIDELPYAKPFPVSKNTTVWEDLESKYFAEAWAGQMTIEAAAREVARQMNVLLAQEG